MSFDNYYPRRKDWRKPYRRSKSFDRSCRNHGGCGYCRDNRTINKKRLKAQEEISMSEYKQTSSSLVGKRAAPALTDSVEYEQTTTSLKNTGTKVAPCNDARASYSGTGHPTTLKTGTKS